MYFGWLPGGYRELRLRERKYSVTLYIKPYPQEFVSFTKEKFYQIVYSSADASVHDKENESRLNCASNGLNFYEAGLCPWRIKKEGDGYVISNPIDKKVLCCWNFSEENIWQIYYADQSAVPDQN